MSKEADIAILQTLTDIKVLLGRIATELRSQRVATQTIVALNMAGTTDAISAAAATILSRMQD